MTTIELTTTEFRQNQKKFLDLAANGVSIIICRGKELFMLNRVRPQQVLDDATMQKIATAREQFSKGETTSVSSREELSAFLNSL